MTLNKWLLAAVATIAGVCLAPAARAQGYQYHDVAMSATGHGLAGANIAVCAPVATVAASVTNGVATLTMAANPVTAGYLANKTVTVAGFTGGDTYFNGSSTAVAVTSTQIIYPLAHANASASSNGTALQEGDSLTSCAGLVPLFTDYTLTTPLANPLTTDGMGNYAFSIDPAVGQAWIQTYGPGITTTLAAVSIPCVTGSSCAGGGGPGGGTVNAGTTDALAIYPADGTTVGPANTAPTANGSYHCGYFVSSNLAVPPTCPMDGLAPRSVAGTTNTDAVLWSDVNNLIQYKGSVAVGVALPTPSSLGNANFFAGLENITSGSATSVIVTPATWTINGLATLTIAQGQRCVIYVDPATSTNWTANCSDLPLSAGSGITIARGQYGPTISAIGSWGLPVTTSDYLHPRHKGFTSGFTETIAYRIRDTSGVEQNYSYTNTVGAMAAGGVPSNSAAYTQIPVAGTLVSVAVTNSNGAPSGSGLVLELLVLKAASYSAANTVATLISAYESNANVLFYPNNFNFSDPTQNGGQGRLIYSALSSPASATDFTCTVQTGACGNFGNGIERVRVTGFHFTLTTAAGGSARQTSFELQVSAGAPIIHVAAPATQAGGLAYQYTFCTGCVTSSADATNQVIALPDWVVIDPAYTAWLLATKTTNITTSDQLSGMTLFGRGYVAQ